METQQPYLSQSIIQPEFETPEKGQTNERETSNSQFRSKLQSQIQNNRSDSQGLNSNLPAQINQSRTKAPIRAVRTTSMTKQVEPSSNHDLMNRSLIQTFQNESNPFHLGMSRHNKVRYDGSPQDPADSRLFRYTTFSRSQNARNNQTFNLSHVVTGIENFSTALPQNQIIEDIMQDEDVIVKNDLMITNLISLKEMKLLQNYNLHAQKLDKKQRVLYVTNDYHSRATNNGYNRNILGYFFTR